MKEEKDGMEQRHRGRENSCCSVESDRGDIWCESGGTSMEAAKVGGKCGSIIPGTSLSCWAAR